MSDTKNTVEMYQAETSAHIALGAGLISSTLFIVAASLVAVGCLIASTQPIGAIPEGSDDNIRVMFWGFLSLINVMTFYFFGISGLIKTLRAYKELNQRS